MAQVTGRAFIKVGGRQLKSREGAKLGFGSREREAVVGDDSVHGYKEKLTAPYVECEISHDANTSLAELEAIRDTTVTFECDSGKTYVLRNAWQANQLELEATEGRVALRFDAVSCEEA